MKSILPFLALIIGFGTGWYFSGQRIQENVKAVMPDEMHETLESVAEYLDPMTKEEVNETMNSIREFAIHAVNEGNHRALWDALNGDVYKSKLKKKGKDAAIQYADARIQFFHEQYEEGMELGESQMIADSLYTRTKKEEIQTQ